MLPLGERPLLVRVGVNYKFSKLLVDRVEAVDSTYDVLFIGTGSVRGVKGCGGGGFSPTLLSCFGIYQLSWYDSTFFCPPQTQASCLRPSICPENTVRVRRSLLSSCRSFRYSKNFTPSPYWGLLDVSAHTFKQSLNSFLDLWESSISFLDWIWQLLYCEAIMNHIKISLHFNTEQRHAMCSLVPILYSHDWNQCPLMFETWQHVLLTVGTYSNNLKHAEFECHCLTGNSVIHQDRVSHYTTYCVFPAGSVYNCTWKAVNVSSQMVTARGLKPCCQLFSVIQP